MIFEGGEGGLSVGEEVERAGREDRRFFSGDIPIPWLEDDG